MSAFQVFVTPTRSKNKRVESREPAEVFMAPFSAKAIVQFEDVPVTKTAKRVLRIINPSEEDIEVKVTRPIKPEHNISIDWTENVVPAYEEVLMEMIWTPQIEVACKETMQITDNRNFRKDVMVILKSKSNKPAKTVRKFPTISSSNGSSKGTHVKTLRLKSPTSSGTKINIASAQHRRKYQKTEKATVAAASAIAAAGPPQPHWNSSIYVPAKAPKQIEASSHRVTKSPSPLSERNVFAGVAERTYAASLQSSPSPQNDYEVKENVSPLTPNNVMNLIDKLNFTPNTSQAVKQTPNSRLSNLAAWPTPVSTIYREENIEHTNLRPRRLTAEGLTAQQFLLEESEVHSTTTIITNKTFEVKRTEHLEMSASISSEDQLLDNSANYGATVTLNKTTVIASTPHIRQLEMIREEEPGNGNTPTLSAAASCLQRTYVRCDESSNSPDLKRDIKLVGTPLRKYSESMKDLSLKTPPSKLATQGSMPNLNEMENIRSIEQNRYFHQSGSGSTHCLRRDETSAELQRRAELDVSMEAESMNEISTISQVDILFNQSEILAQSSRFNLNEVGLKSRKRSPVPAPRNIKFISKQAGGTPPRNAKHTPPRATPPKSTKSTPPKVMLTKPTPPRPAIGAVRKLGPQQLNEKAGSATSHKRLLSDISFSDTDSIGSTNSIKSSVKSGVIIVSPPKRQRIDTSFGRPAVPVNASSPRGKSWSLTQPKKFRLAKTLSLVKKPITPLISKEERPRVKLYDSDLFMQTCINPDPFAATTTCDPFLATTMYLDEQAVDKHQIEFKKWLNALVSIPADLDADCNAKIDLGKLFNEVRHKELTIAPTKEEQSMSYLTVLRLESLRRAAVKLFLSEEMSVPCSKIAVYVNKHAIRIRNDRNLHLDVVMQRNILELLLCFNPLWLRLGLEVVFGEKIHLNGNNDIVGLSTFVLNRLFRDKFIEQKYSKAYTLSDEYAEHIKKFTLQKMLFLLLFLDKAKNKHIIKHNPCLFVKKSPYKETKEILLRFSSELLANVGDITRELRRLDYVLQHKQCFLDEFDYAFNNLAVDLRDGIRLTRVMEIILLREDLSRQLRVPAISRLQRVFNVNLGLKALNEADFQLRGNITATDIVDGHREKTLSLLWQIIYKFRSPKFHAAAKVLQQWWRHCWLTVVIRRRIAQKTALRREAAATCIQAAFRGYMTRKYAKVYRKERVQAAIVLQKYVRRRQAQQQLKRSLDAVVCIQHWWRAQLLGAHCRGQYLLMRHCVIFLQRSYRRRLGARLMEQLAKALRMQRELKRVAAATQIQRQWRGYAAMKRDRRSYLELRQSAVVLQRAYRGKTAMMQTQQVFLKLRSSVISVQRRFRAKRQMCVERAKYLRLRACVIKLQQRRRALLLMRADRTAFVHQQNAVITIQRRFRATCAMKEQRTHYQHTLSVVCKLQIRYRSLILMRKQAAIYTETRQKIIYIQRKWRATLLARQLQLQFISMQYYATVVQQTFRGIKKMHQDRAAFLKARHDIISMQRRYRSKLKMRKERADFLNKKRAVITIQQRFRAYKQMRLTRAKFCGMRAAALCLQEHIRGYLAKRRDRKRFLCVRQGIVLLQRVFRARQAMRIDRAAYEKYKASVICVQRRYRGRRLMQLQRHHYEHQRQLIIGIQRRFRSKLMARQIRASFLQQRECVVLVQRRYRATMLMRTVRANYLNERSVVIKLQQRFRALLLMRQTRTHYQRQLSAVNAIQQWYRSILTMRRSRSNYQQLQNCCIRIQRKWRATIAARSERQRYIWTVQKLTFIQIRVRATLKMRQVRQAYLLQRQAAITLQRHYRARRSMLLVRSQYLLLRSLIICIQRRYRAHRAMLVERQDFLLLRATTIHIQQLFRGRKLMREVRDCFQYLRRGVVPFQAHARGLLARQRFHNLMTPEMRELLRRQKATRLIQRFWRGYRVRKRFHNLRIVIIRRNIVLLQKTCSSVNSIRMKMQEAVSTLRGRSSASDMLNVLAQLERLSRTVPHLLIVHADFVSTFCYGIMAQAIRSEVDKQLIRYCSRIILNLARYNSTTANTFQEGGLTTIAQMLLRWCDKDSEIFNALCTLIWIFIQCPKKRRIIREFMTTPEAIYVVRETKKLVARKEKMKQNVRNQVAIQRDQKQHFSSRALPSLEPDYGVIHNKPYTFISSVYAFDTILCKLNIDIF